jgi:hypothetical protein
MAREAKTQNAEFLRGAAELSLKAAALYKEIGSSERVAAALSLAAKLLEGVDANRAKEIYKEAATMYEVDDKENFANETYKDALNFLIKEKFWDDAIELMKVMCKAYKKLNYTLDAFRLYLSMIILHLNRNDIVAADRTYQEALVLEGFITSEEGVIANDLLRAFENNSSEELKKVQSKQLLTFLDNEVPRLFSCSL